MMKKQIEILVSEPTTQSQADSAHSQKGAYSRLPPLSPKFESERLLRLTPTSKFSQHQKRFSLKAFSNEQIDHLLDLCNKAHSSSDKQKINGTIKNGKLVVNSVHSWVNTLSEGLKVSSSQEELEKIMKYKSKSQEITDDLIRECKAQAKKDLNSMTGKIIKIKKPMLPRLSK